MVGQVGILTSVTQGPKQFPKSPEELAKDVEACDGHRFDSHGSILTLRTPTTDPYP